MRPCAACSRSGRHASAAGEQQRDVHSEQRRGDDEEFAHLRGRIAHKHSSGKAAQAPFYRHLFPIDFTPWQTASVHAFSLLEAVLQGFTLRSGHPPKAK